MAARREVPPEQGEQGPEKRATTQVTIRLFTDTLEHYKRVAARDQVPWTQLIRATLSRGFLCELGKCNHAVKAARKVAHLGAYEKKFGHLAPPKGAERPKGESAPTVVSEFVPDSEMVADQSVDNGVAHDPLEAATPDDDPLAAPELPSFQASFVLEEHNAWVPIPAWRLLDDRGLVAKGCCVEHRQMREECDAAQLHDEGR